MTELEIIQKYSALVRILALSRTSCQSDADDVYQEVFYRYIDKHPKFRDEEHAKAWFIRVTVNITRNMHKSFDRSRRVDLREEDISDLISDSDIISESEKKADFEMLLSRLNPRYKAVLMLHFDCGYTVREMADLLGESQPAVKALLVHDKQKLKELMTERNDWN